MVQWAMGVMLGNRATKRKGNTDGISTTSLNHLPLGIIVGILERSFILTTWNGDAGQGLAAGILTFCILLPTLVIVLLAWLIG